MAGEADHAQVATERVPASIVAPSHVAIIGITASGAVSTCNPAAARLYGYVPPELIGRPAELLVPPGLRAEEAAVVRRVVAGEEVEPYLTERVRQDGSVVTVSLTISPMVGAEGDVVGVTTVSHPAGDVSDAADRIDALVNRQRADARDAEDRYQAGLDADRARERVQVQEAEDRFEVRMDAERAKERVQVHEAADRFHVGLADERARKRAEALDAEDRFQSGMATERALDIAELQDAQNRSQEGMDLERAEARRDRERLEAQLQQGQRLEVLGQLAGGVAHDFNNILAVILNYAAFVADELADGSDPDVAAAARDVAQIQRAAERAAALTHQLLAFARREVVRPRVLDLNRVVANVEEMLSRTIGEDVILQAELAEDLWPVLMDPGQVEQVLMNVAVNARDAMVGGGTLRIDTANVVVDAEPSAPDPSAAAPSVRHVRLRVSDTGSGMPADVLDRVFEPFFTTKGEGLGSGLGLATVYGIVTQAGGTIAMRSKPGAGTTVEIMIPATDGIAVPSGEISAGEPARSGDTVLVVEDEEALRTVTERIFARNGYRVITAGDGEEALALAGDHDGEIHLLVTDVVMPKMLGNEVAERIRRIRPGIEVLYMSGYALRNVTAPGTLGDVHLIEKPFSATALIEKTGQILSGRDGLAARPDGSAAPAGLPVDGSDPPEDLT